MIEGQLVLACIGREEKMLNPAYIDALAQILAACPGATFVWTGRATRSHEVMEMMTHARKNHRCRFIGWLEDTKAAATLMDIFVDTFPFGSGFTAFEAMAAGKPVVALRTPETIETSAMSRFC